MERMDAWNRWMLDPIHRWMVDTWMLDPINLSPHYTIHLSIQSISHSPHAALHCGVYEQNLLRMLRSSRARYEWPLAPRGSERGRGVSCGVDLGSSGAGRRRTWSLGGGGRGRRPVASQPRAASIE